ncbi:MAG: hypothetical protein K2J70_01990 [Muribaculaceae bacterium]|nr:hypothetical protein [Muribaculaceae bacterium]
MTAGRKVNTFSQSWCTPPKYVNAIKDFWGGEIQLDPCSNDYSMVGATMEYKLPETDGLQMEWRYRTIYVNPPYGADRLRGTTIKNWLAKCTFAHEEYNAEVIALIPAATNTSHWKKYVFGAADAICFLADTRLRFYVNGSEHEKGAPMACCLIYWGDKIKNFIEHFDQYGAAIDISDLKNKKISLNDRSLFDEEFCGD